MRTFVRFLAFLAVFAYGVILVVSGAMWLDSVQPPPSEPVSTGTAELDAAMDKLDAEFDPMFHNDALEIAGQHLLSLGRSPENPPTLVEKKVALRLAYVELAAKKPVKSGVSSGLMGLVLMVSATVLVAVRPKVRQTVGKPIAGRSAAVPPRAQVSTPPVSVTIGDSQKQGEVTVSFEAALGRDGKSVWRKVVPGHWRHLQPGWTEDQVRQLLDGPVKVRPAKATTGEAVSVWHYYSGVFRVSGGKGTVTFKDGKVVGFTAPPSEYARWVLHTPNPQA